LQAVDLDSTRIQMDALGHTPIPIFFIAATSAFSQVILI